MILEDLSNHDINKLRIETFETIDLKINLKLEEFMMTRLVSMKIKIYQNWLQQLLKN